MFFSGLMSFQYWDISENHSTWTHLWHNSIFLQKQNEFIDVFTMVHQTSNCHIQEVMNNLKFIILDYLAVKIWDSGLTQRFLWLVLKQLLYLEVNALQTSYQVQYILRDNASHAHWTLINGLKPSAAACLQRYMFSVIYYAHVRRNIRLYDWSNVAWNCGRCYHYPKRSLLIVSTYVLCLKDAESYLETSQCTHFPENPDYEMWKEHILSHIRRNPDKLKIFIKKNIEIIRTPSFIQFWRRSGLTESRLTVTYCSLSIKMHIFLISSKFDQLFQRYWPLHSWILLKMVGTA